MPKHVINLKGRSLLRMTDLNEAELAALLDLAGRLKRKKKRGIHGSLLTRKNLALIFEKSSTRTRSAFTVAAVDEGASAEYMDTGDIHFGRKESIKDTARVLGRMYDGIMFRGFKQSTVESLARHAGIPVWNGLTDDEHPTQALADLFTIRERFGRLKGLTVVYVGDGRNNVCLSLMIACALSGMHFVDCTPAALSPDRLFVARARALARKNGGSVTVTHDPLGGVRGANVLYTDVWASMGEEALFRRRLRLLRPYQVNMAMIRRTGNPGKVIFLHCLPAYHNHDTDVTRKTGALEVADDVFEAPFSRVFDQAENRMHTIKALIVATMTGKGG